MDNFDELNELNELLKKLGLPPIEDLEPDPTKQRLLAKQLTVEFSRLVEADQQGDRGGYKIRIGNFHGQLSRSGWPLLELGAKLTFAAMKHSWVNAAEAVFTFVTKVRGLVTKLDETERLIYENVAAVSDKKHTSDKVLIELGASQKDLDEYFDELDLETPANLPARLQEMVSKGVLRADTYGDRGPFYQVVF